MDNANETNRPTGQKGATMHISTSFQSVSLPNGRFVNIGHYVTNFNTRAVVVGLATDPTGRDSSFPMLQVREERNGKLLRGGWLAAVRFCQ